jgi:hypothetical protein
MLAAKLMTVHLKDPFVLEGIQSQCIPSRGYLALPYTGFNPVDAVLCPLVALFLESLKPRNETFTTYLIVQLAPITSFSFIEAVRSQRP